VLDGKRLASYTVTAMPLRIASLLRARINRTLLALFSRKPEPGSIARHRWASNFEGKEKNRHLERVMEESCRCDYGKGHFFIEFRRPDLFAWAEERMYRYSDFVVETSFDLPSPAGESMQLSAGFLLRKVGDGTFYYFLLSDTGMFRFDFVFNGHPRPLIPWTAAPSGDQSGIRKIKIIARGTSFTFFVDDKWAGEIEDDGSETGALALAGQRYHDAAVSQAPVALRFHSLLIESRPLEVENEYLHWTSVIAPSADQRIVFAQRLYGHGNYGPALVQLKRAFVSRRPGPGEELLIARCCMQLHYYESALVYLEKVIENRNSAELEDAMLEKASILYLRNDFTGLLSWLEEVLDSVDFQAPLYNLRGNALSALGRFSDAAGAYRKAFELDPEMAAYAYNCAVTLEKCGRKEEACSFYHSAATINYRREAWEDLDHTLSRLRRLDPEDGVAMAIEGKIAFEDENMILADSYLRPLLRNGCTDSSVHYLCALIDLRRGDLEAAGRNILGALALEPDYYLYRFKKAEVDYLQGRHDEETLRALLEENGTDGWSWNLLGLILLEECRFGDALAALEKAVSFLPGEPEPLINRSEALLHLSGVSAALDSLESKVGTCEPIAPILNRKGNLLSSIGRFSEASDAYLAAADLDPEELLYRENGATALLAADRVPEAERILSRLLEQEATPLRYHLTGRCALKTGEYERAEACFRAGVQADPDDPWCRLDTAELHMMREHYSKSEELLDLLEKDPVAGRNPEVLQQLDSLRSRLKSVGGRSFSCDGCGRSWWVPKDLADPGQLRIRGETPHQAPAGKCPSCGSVFCVACAIEHLHEGRFHCSQCKVPLKLSEPELRMALLRMLD
jgi:tetratricopeptide (TPR) repeat protein